MLNLYSDPWFTFRFAEDRNIPRFHLEGVSPGSHVSVIKIDPESGERLGLLATATVGDGGWVDLDAPIIVRAGDAFIAVPSLIRPERAADQEAIRQVSRLAFEELFPEEPGHDSQVYDLVFLPDGKTLISTGLYQKTLLWNVAKHQVRGVLALTAEMLQLSADGKQLAGHTDYAGEVRIWDTTERKEAVKLKMPENFRVITASFAAAPGKLNTVEWHYKENKSGEPVVRQWDLATGKPDGMWPTPAPQDGLNPIVERGKKVYVALSEGGLSIYDIDSKSQRIMPTGEPVQLVRNPLSFDGRVLVTSLRMDAKAPIKLWELLTGKEIWRLTGHEGFKHAVAWSADGRLLASGDQFSLNGSGAAQTIRLWDTASGKQLACFGGLGSDVAALAFTPDGTSLAAGLRDSTILLYDVRKCDPRRGGPARLNQTALESLWNDLRSDQAGKAHQALWQLVDDARDSVPFLKSKMRPRDRVDAAAVQKWIADLDSEKFPVRQEAARQLHKCGGQVRATLDATLKGTLPLETRRRLQDTLKSLDLHELGGHAQPVARLAYAAFQHRLHVEQLPNAPDVLVLPLEGERRRARRHAQVFQPREGHDEVVGDAVAEKLVLVVGVHVHERKDGQGRLAFRW